MVKRCGLFVLFLLIIAGGVFADATKEDIAASLRKDLKHPYLYFTEAEKPVLLERIKTDPVAHDIMARLLAEANRLMAMPVDNEAPPQQKHPRFWSDGKYDSYIGSYTNAAQTLAFIYQMTGDAKYAQKAFEFVDALCDIHLWMMRAHEFPIIYSRVWPWNVKDDQVVFSSDIITGDMGYELGAVYDWLYPALTKQQRDRLRGALLESVITPVRGDWEYHWWTSAYRCNWCGIGMSGLGVSSLALLTEDPQLVDVISEAYNRMGRMFDQLGVDGGWQEGRSYWAYGMRSCIFFMDSLKRLTGGKYDLFKHPRIQSNPASFALYGLTAYFGDGSPDVVGSAHLLNKLIDETENGEAAWYRDTFIGVGGDMFDIIWPKSDVPPVEPAVKSKHFRSIDWAVMRSDFKNSETVTVACKAGLNDDPHHGHLDVGQVIVNWRGQAFIRDIGHGPYDEQYFDELRWQYPQASSAGHNLIFVNGELQICAKYKDKPWQEGVGGKILEFRTGDKRHYTLMDPTNAYPKKELKDWRRHVILEKPVITVLLDEVTAERGAEIEARFHSACPFDIRDNFVLLKGKGGTMALIPILDIKYTFREGKHTSLARQKDAKPTWIPYFGTVTKAKKGTTFLATVILPVKDETEARAVVKSAKQSFDRDGIFTLSFSKDGKIHSFIFKERTDGLVLE